MQEIIEQLREALPPVFLGSAIDKLTGGAICWGTVQNKRCHREVPEECFVRAGPRVLVVRDPFLSWWGSTLRPARETNQRYAPHLGAGRQEPVSCGPTRGDVTGALDHAQPRADILSRGRQSQTASSTGREATAPPRRVRSRPREPAAG
jgi:hypothetical protein